MKALKLLLMDRHELGNPKIVTTEMFNEAIAELEALQSTQEAQLKEAKFAITVLNENLKLNSELLKAKDEKIYKLEELIRKYESDE